MGSFAESGIPFTEATDSFKGTNSGDKYEFTKTFFVAYADLQLAMYALLPSWFVLADGSWVYTAGDTQPEDPFAYCFQCDFEVLPAPPQDGTDMFVDGASKWDTAKLTCHYKVPSFDPAKEQEIYELDLDFSAEEVILPGGSFKSEGGDVIMDPIRKIIPTCTIGITLVDVPQLPGGDASMILSKYGNINTDALFGAAPKKVLFCGARTSRTTTNKGKKGWRIYYKFLYRQYEWDKVFVNQNGQFVQVEAVNGGDPLYPSTALHSLIPSYVSPS